MEILGELTALVGSLSVPGSVYTERHPTRDQGDPDLK
jgi:hypothetical protein